MNLSPFTRQVIYSSASLMIMVNSGLMYGFSAILIPALLDKNSDLQTDMHTASWIASLPGISGFVTVLSLGPLMHVYGRRTAHLTFLLPMTFGWILFSLSHSIQLLFIARTVQGLSKGFVYFCSVCIAELTSPKIRGIMLNLKVFSVSVGIGLVHLCGMYFHWRTVALIGVLPTSISFIIALFWPESPEWLVSKQRYEDAEQAFYTIRGFNTETREEIKTIIEAEKMRQLKRECEPSLKNNLKMLKSGVLWRPVILLACAVVIPEAGGRHYIPTYSVTIAKQIFDNDSTGYLCTIIVDAVCIGCSLISNFFIPRIYRRTLLVKCGYFGVAMLMIASIVLYIRSNIFDNTALVIVQVVLFVCYFVIVFSSTFGVCYVIMGELLPLEYRPIGTIIDGVLSNILLTVFLKITPTAQEHLQVYGMFITFAVVMLIALFYMHYDLPETKNRTLLDISNYFRGKSSKLGRNKSNEEKSFVKNCDTLEV